MKKKRVSICKNIIKIHAQYIAQSYLCSKKQNKIVNNTRKIRMSKNSASQK